MLPPKAISSGNEPRGVVAGSGSGSDVAAGMGGGQRQLLYSSGVGSTAPAAAQRWTEEQSAKLRELVGKSGPKDWTNIAKKVAISSGGTRTAVMVCSITWWGTYWLWKTFVEVSTLIVFSIMRPKTGDI